MAVSKEEGPMQPSFFYTILIFLFLGPTVVCRIIVLPGEAESGSAGTQPDKE